MKKPPDKIYLQWYDEDGEPAEEATWCVDRINDNDVVYVRQLSNTQAEWIAEVKRELTEAEEWANKLFP